MAGVRLHSRQAYQMALAFIARDMQCVAIDLATTVRKRLDGLFFQPTLHRQPFSPRGQCPFTQRDEIVQ